jgi:glycosyltransferase involved in cell wall biosynthesis
MAKKLSELTPSLSVLICTKPDRFAMLETLVSGLNEQIKKNKLSKEVEILTDDRMDITVGQKRNELIDQSKGKFVAFIDDDDEVHTDYLKLIVETIKEDEKIDCIGINGVIIFDKLYTRKWFVSMTYGDWHEKDSIFYRTPNHIAPIKRDLAIKCKFPDLNFGEDKHFSDLVLPLLKKEAIIDTPLYVYNKKSESPYIVWR